MCGEANRDRRPGARSTDHRELSVEGVDAILHDLQPHAARCGGRIEALPLVADLEGEVAPLIGPQANRAPGVPAVSDHVLDRLETAEVDAGLGVGVEPCGRNAGRG